MSAMVSDHQNVVGAPQTAAVYAVPSKPSHQTAGGVTASGNATVDQGRRLGQRHVQKPVKPRRSDGGIKIGQLRAAAAASSSNRPRIPIELMSAKGPPAVSADGDRLLTEDDLGFDDVITMAAANGYVDNGQRERSDIRCRSNGRNQLVETILPPPEVFSDAGADASATVQRVPSNGEATSSGRSANWSAAHHRQPISEAFYSEVVDELRSRTTTGNGKSQKKPTTLQTMSMESRDVLSSQENGKPATNGKITVIN